MKWIFTLSDEEYKACKKFADDSSNSQREYRSGGTMQRSVGQIFYDTFRGKVGEIVVKHFLEQEPLKVKGIHLDFGVYHRGVWDTSDIELNGKRIAVKSSKHFARWLLLETKDIKRGDSYDYYILVLINEDFKEGKINGFAYKKEIIEPNKETLFLQKGEFIPYTSMVLDADNHARHSDNLHNSEKDWIEFARDCNGR